MIIANTSPGQCDVRITQATGKELGKRRLTGSSRMDFEADAKETFDLLLTSGTADFWSIPGSSTITISFAQKGK